MLVFSSLGWGEILILGFAGLVILGPERLPGAIQWTFKSLRQVRDYASGATDQLKQDLGGDFNMDDFREPLAQLNSLRSMTPRAAITKHLLDGDDSIFSEFDKTRTSLTNDLNEVKAAGNLRSRVTDAINPTAASTAAGSTATSPVPMTKSAPAEAPSLQKPTGTEPASGGQSAPTKTWNFDDAT